MVQGESNHTPRVGHPGATQLIHRANGGGGIARPLVGANGHLSKIKNESSFGNCLHIDLEGIIEYSLNQIRTLFVCTPMKGIRANRMTFNVNWTSCIGQAGVDCHQVRTVHDVCWFERRIESSAWVSTTEP